MFHTDVHTIEFCYNRHDTEIQILQADNAKEYEKLGRVIFQKYGTRAQFTNAYTPQQNGVAERRMRTIMERLRALLLDGKLPNGRTRCARTTSHTPREASRHRHRRPS